MHVKTLCSNKIKVSTTFCLKVFKQMLSFSLK